MVNWIICGAIVVILSLVAFVIWQSPSHVERVAPKLVATVGGCQTWRVYDEDRHKFVYLNQCGNVTDPTYDDGRSK